MGVSLNFPQLPNSPHISLLPGLGFAWNQRLDKAFRQSNQIIVGLVKKGVTTFDTNWITCFAPDWSKENMIFMLLPKHCICLIENGLICYPEGWCIVFETMDFASMLSAGIHLLRVKQLRSPEHEKNVTCWYWVALTWQW